MLFIWTQSVHSYQCLCRWDGWKQIIKMTSGAVTSRYSTRKIVHTETLENQRQVIGYTALGRSFKNQFTIWHIPHQNKRKCVVGYCGRKDSYMLACNLILLNCSLLLQSKQTTLQTTHSNHTLTNHKFIHTK